MNLDIKNQKSSPIFLGETLANHRRGRILKTTVAAQPVEEQPEAGGICLLFGTDFQGGSKEEQQSWVDWSQKPGRTLLLIPPFQSKNCDLPVSWQAQRRLKPVSHKDNSLPKALAPEVQYELQGQLQIAHSVGGTWDDQSLCTIYYRKHPHAGIFAITCLPLWSLMVLDCASALQQWLQTLHDLSGEFQPENEPDAEEEEIDLQPGHFTLLLHLLTQEFTTEAEALEALNHSPIFTLTPPRVTQCLKELQTYGLIKNLSLTDHGQEILARSPYAHYAAELEALTL